MATKTDLLTISFLVEQDSAKGDQAPFPVEEIRKAVLTAIAVSMRDRPDVQTTWESSEIVPLDGKPAVGRCAVCNRWVHDVENRTPCTPTGISRGAMVDGQYLCDEHLPVDHPWAF